MKTIKSRVSIWPDGRTRPGNYGWLFRPRILYPFQVTYEQRISDSWIVNNCSRATSVWSHEWSRLQESFWSITCKRQPGTLSVFWSNTNIRDILPLGPAVGQTRGGVPTPQLLQSKLAAPSSKLLTKAIFTAPVLTHTVRRDLEAPHTLRVYRTSVATSEQRSWSLSYPQHELRAASLPDRTHQYTFLARST
jgi:hypothetical protein